MPRPPDRYDGPPADVVYPDPPGLELTAADYRARVVAALESQLGVTDPTRYWLDVHGSVPVPGRGKRIHWCGALALWALRRAGLCDWMWSFSPRRPGFIFRIGWTTTRTPRPGDIVYSLRAQHHAIVSGEIFERDKQLIVPSIDGNTGAAPGIVARKERALNRRDVYYYPIAKLVDAAIERDRVLAISDTEPAPPPEGAA